MQAGMVRCHSTMSTLQATVSYLTLACVNGAHNLISITLIFRDTTSYCATGGASGPMCLHRWDYLFWIVVLVRDTWHTLKYAT